MIHKITLLTAAVVLALVAGLTPRAFAQSYETQHASKIMLPSNGNDPTNTLTIVANALTHSTTLKFPDGFGAAAGSILTNDGSGVLSWTAPGLSTITPGTMGQFLITNSSTAVAWSNFLISTDFTGNGATTNLAIAQTSAAGADIIAALTANAGSITNNTSGNATTSTTASNVVTNTVSNNASYYPALLSSATGVASTPVDVGGSALSYNPSTGTLSSTNFSGALNNSGASPTTNIDNSATGGTTNIGNGTSTTYINGALDITGTVTYTSTPSIPLASNDILIGNGLSPSEGVAAPMTQDVSLSYTGGNAQATVNGSHATTFAVTNAETVGGTLTSSGNVSLDASPSSGGTVVIGNSAGPSTTTINGALNITGAVTYTTVPSLPLPSADIFVGNGASPSIAAAVAMSGDATISNTGLLTIGNNKVTYGKMQAVSTTSRLLGSSATTTPVQEITLGSGLSITGSQLNTVNNGNVTSGTLVNNGAVYATSASAIASTTQMTAGQLLIGSGASSVPLLGTITTSGSGITATYTSPNIVLANTGVTSLSGGTTGLTDGTGTGTVTLTGTLISTNGGTGVSNPTAHDLLIAEGATAMTPISGAAGTVLVGNGSSTDPSFSAVPTLGVPGTTAGTLTLASGAAAFSTTVQTSATTPASTYIYQLPAQPTGLPTAGNVLTIGTPTGTGPYTVPLTWTVPNSTTGVLYNQTTEQATVPISSTPLTPSFLFNVGYNNTVVADSAAGAVINSINTNTANTTNDGPLHNADGFTVNVTATGGTNGYGNATGLIVNATAPVGGIPTGLAVTIKGDSIGPEFLLHNNSGKGSRSIIETVDSELDLTQTGDLYGSSILRMQNRTGANGAIFQTVSNSTDTGTDLVDWGFIPGNDVQSNVRLEARHKWASGVSPNNYGANEYLRSSANISAAIPEEFQYFFGTTGSAPRYVLDVGENATMLERGSFAIGYGDTVAGDTAVGSPRERLDVHSPGTFWGGNSDAGYKGASNIILSDSGTATVDAPYVGALEFQGLRTGLSTFQAGAQGTNTFNYTWPTTAPTAGQVLTASTVGSSSPYAIQFGWGSGGSSAAGSGVYAGANDNTGAFTGTSTLYTFPYGRVPANGVMKAVGTAGIGMTVPTSGGVLQNFTATLSSALTSGNITLSLYDVTAAATTGLTVTFTNASGTTQSDNTHTYTVPSGHVLSLQYNSTSTPAPATENATWAFLMPGVGGNSTGLTNPMTSTGDIIYSSDNSGDAQRLGVGTTAQFLGVSGGIPAWTSTLTSTSGLGTTSADGLLIQNTTAATSGTPIQYSPRLHLSGTAYESTGSHSETDGWTIEDQPVNGSTSTTSNLVIADESNGLTAESVDAVFSSGGMLTLGTATGETGTLALAPTSNTDYTEFQPGTATPSYTYVYQMPSQAAAPPASEFLETGTPVLSGSTYTIPLTWNTAGSSTGVSYNVATGSPQNTATSTNYLFDVAYASTSGTVNALGALINSAVTTGSGGNTTGLTIQSTGHNTTGTSIGLVLDVTGGATNTDITGTAGWSVSSAGAATFAGITDAGTTTINNTGTATTQIGNVAGFGNVTIGNIGTGAGSINLNCGTTGEINLDGAGNVAQITNSDVALTNTAALTINENAANTSTGADTKTGLAITGSGSWTGTGKVFDGITLNVTGGTTNNDIVGTSGNWSVTNAGNATLTGITKYGGVATVSNGVASEYGAVNATTQGANISSATAYAVPSGGVGMYRVSITIAVTRAASFTSTMPSVTLGWTDGDGSNATHTLTATATSGGNSTTTTFAQTSVIVYANSSSNITYSTASYASSGATSMQYAVHVIVEAL